MILVIHILLLKERLLLQEQLVGVEKNRSLAFKNNAPFISCISKQIKTKANDARVSQRNSKSSVNNINC